MEDRKILNEQRTKRFWRGFRIGAAVGVILSLLGFGSILLSGAISPYLIAVFYFVISVAARILYAIIGQEFYPYLLSSFLLILLTNSILAGLVGAVCGHFLKRRKDSIGRSTD